MNRFETKRLIESLENADLIVILINREACVEYINRSGANLLHVEADRIIGRDWFDTFSHPDAKISEISNFNDIINGRGPISSLTETKIVDGNKHPRWIRWSNSIWSEESNGPIDGILSIGIDISAYKDAFDSLKKSEERYKTLFDSSRDALMILTPEEGFLAGNEATIRMFDCGDEETFKSLAPGDLSPEFQPDGRHSGEKAMEMIDTAMVSGAHFFEWKHKRYRGDEFDATVLLTRTILAGKPVLQATVRDISVQKRSEKALRESEERFRTLFQTSSDALMILTREEGFFAGNRAAIDMFDCKDETQFRSLSPMDLSPEFQPDGMGSGEKALEMMNLAMKNGRHLFEWKHKRYKGDEFFATVLLTRTELNGKPVLQATVRDISEEKRREAAEQHQKRIEKKYKLIFEHSKDMIFISNSKGKFIDMNPAGVEMLGYNSLADLKKIDIANDLYETPDMRERFKKMILKNGYVNDYRSRLKRKDGSLITILETATSLKDEETDENLYLGIMRDVTQRESDEQDLLRMNIELIDMNKKMKEAQGVLIQQEKMASLGGLAAGIAHEINNPLGFVMSNFRTLNKYMEKIKGFIETQYREMASDQHQRSDGEKSQFLKEKKKIDFLLEDIEDIFEESNDGFERIATIVENMRRFSRVDSENDFAFVQLNESIKNTLIIAKNSYKYVADVVTDFGTIPEIECNASEINQVLLNIIVNAAQAIQEKDNDEERGKIKIRTFEADPYVCCRISDNGGGIPETLLTKIFDPFFTTKSVGSGTGLGLSISYDIIVNKHRGQLSAESKTEAGTTFTIKLPIKRG